MAHLHIREETTKNVKASLLTAATCTLVGLVFFFTHWEMQRTPQPVADNGIEVNLGFGDEGFGDVAPLVPGEPAPDVAAATEDAATPAIEEDVSEASTLPNNTVSDEVAVHKEVVKNDDKKAPAIRTTAKPKSVAKTTAPVEKLTVSETKKKAAAAPTAAATNKKTVASDKTAATGTARTAMPKAVYRGGTGTGGNNADSYNGVTSQGIAGGRGDQGRTGGNLTSDSYTGNGGTGRSGVSIREGLSGRKIIGYPSFTDNFNQNAKVAVRIVVDSDGKVTSASVDPKGTTTTNSAIRNIAISKAKQLKLSKSTAKAQTGTILFNFKLTG